MARLPRRSEGMSISRLAQHLGLAEGTVSRALNNYPDIATKTRERVADAARELGYRPSSAARRLARGVIETVGFVLPARGAHLSDPFLSEIMDGLAVGLAAHDWDLIVAAVPEDHDELEVMDRLIKSGKVGSFVITRTRRQDPRVEFLKASGLPFVVHGRTDKHDDYSWLDVDNKKAFVDAVTFLHELGHTRIALLGGDTAMNFAWLRRAGYLQAMEDLGLGVAPGYLVDNVTDGDATTNAIAALLALDPAPTGIVCVTDSVAIDAIAAIRRAGLMPGREISVTGYDGLATGAAIDPPLTTMSQASYEAGREVGRMILALHNNTNPQHSNTNPQISHILWEAKLTLRASANPPVTSPANR